MTYYIYSTHTNSINYVEYDKTVGKNHNVVKRRFNVAGGHGLCNKNFVTPQGVVTIVHKEDDMEWLYSLEAFNKDITNGFIKVLKRREDSEKVVKKDMNLRDGSAPKTPADYKLKDASTNSYATTSASSII